MGCFLISFCLGNTFIAPVYRYPGEGEIQALYEGAMRVVRGEEEAKIYE